MTIIYSDTYCYKCSLTACMGGGCYKFWNHKESLVYDGDFELELDTIDHIKKLCQHLNQ